MSMTTERGAARKSQAQKRDVAFVVRAKTGPSTNDWNTVGVAFERKNGEPGYTIKLNTLPIDRNWNGSLIMVPPIMENMPDDDQS